MQDDDLVRLSKQGDDSAFEELMNQTKEQIFYHCLSIVKDEEAAKDLTQESFLHAYQHLADFKMRSSFSTWVWRIAHNLCLNYLKKEKHQEVEWNEEKIAAAPIEDDNADDFYKYVETFLPLLDEKYRIVFEMYDLKRIPQKEIAARLNIPHGTVRSRLYYARKKMRQWLKKEDLQKDK